jgi:hypothetical protein
MKEALICAYDGCAELAVSYCENCGASFCEDHGSRGGDRETEGGLRAVPAACWRCGGFNADE